MIRYLAHKDIDQTLWDDCVGRSANGLVYAYSWFLNRVAGEWDALILDDYEAVMPLPTRKKAGMSYIFQPHFIQQLGVFGVDRPDKTLVKDFIRAIPEHFRWIDLALNTCNPITEASPWRLEKRITHALDLQPEYWHIRSAYTENTLRNLKKSQKFGVFIGRGNRPDEVIRAFRSGRGKGVSAWSDKEYRMLERLVYEGMHKGTAEVWNAYTAQNSFCAGGVFFRSHRKAIFLFSGSTLAGREQGAMFSLVDHFIRMHAGKALLLDFEGSRDPGLARFYRGFGSKEYVFLQLRINRMPAVLKPLAWLYHHHRRLRAGMPLIPVRT